MNMESLISIMNKLHDVFNVTGPNLVQLPQIVVVGSQSSGKSSVLESLVGRDFLPRGRGIVTRCPLILQLIYTAKNCSVPDVEDSTLQTEEWGTFLHTGDKIFTDFQEIRKEINAEMERKSGTQKGISSETINLRIFSPHVVNLTLVDLPGISKVPVGDQPPDIEMQVKQLILHYINNPNAIILAVTAANTDFATSESLKFARECDPEGKRTLAVITKLDLMDAGTDATDVLCGQVIPVKLGIIGVVNRSQQDIINNKNINDAIKDEFLFLQRTYPTLALRNGTKFLRKRLNYLLINHIRQCLPYLKSKINNMISQYEILIHSYGSSISDPNKIVLEIITKFTSLYCSAIEGTVQNIETSELSGGARICYIFHKTFSSRLKNINPLSGLKSLDILTAIRNATGTRPALFIPEVVFELLVKQQIQRLEEPSLRCVELVHEEMQRIVRHCVAEFQQEIHRFPKLHERIIDVVTQLLQERLPAVNTMIKNLISIELAYINTEHPDFYHDFASFHENRIQNVSLKMQLTNFTIEKDISKFGEPLSNICEEKENSSTESHTAIEKSGRNSVVNQKVNLSEPFSKPLQYKTIDEITETNERTSQSIAFNNSQETCKYTQNLAAVENKECKIIKNLIRSYFTIVKKTIQDAVPKAIMHFLVNFIKDNLQQELIVQLYKPENFSSLLQESEQVTKSRKEAIEMLQVLQKSSNIVNEIRDFSV